MTPLAALILAAYAALALAATLCARALHGPAWAGVAVLAGLALTTGARLVVSPDLLFLAIALIWVSVGAFVATRGEGAIAAFLIASGLCYLGAQLANADAPGWSRWFTAADVAGLVALACVSAGGDDGISALARRFRRRLGAGRGPGPDRASAFVAVLEKTPGKGR